MENKLSLLKTQAAAEVDALQKKLIGLGDFLFDHPEPGFQEKKAVQRLTEVLSANGFSVECPYAGLQTAFRGVYEHGKGGPHIGLLCEYDALKNIGHACGHHLQSPAVLGAALAIQKVLGASSEPFGCVPNNAVQNWAYVWQWALLAGVYGLDSMEKDGCC